MKSVLTGSSAAPFLLSQAKRTDFNLIALLLCNNPRVVCHRMKPRETELPLCLNTMSEEEEVGKCALFVNFARPFFGCALRAHELYEASDLFGEFIGLFAPLRSPARVLPICSAYPET